MEIDFKYTVGKRIDACLVYTTRDKQLFKVIRLEKDGSKIYDCHVAKCNAKICIQDGVCSYYEKYTEHSHDDNQEKDFKQFNLELNLKQRCQSDPHLSIRKIFEEECGSTSDANFDKLKSSMLHHRKKALPKNPTSVEGTDNYLQNATVCSQITLNESWLTYEYVKREEYPYLMFESKKILEQLPEDRIFNVTCTMRVVPAGYFKVLMTISVVAKTMAFPCIFTLMSDRSESAYDDVFRKIEEKWIDFERALRSAVCNLYPGINTKSHWYQYVMAVRLKAKKIEGFYQRSYDDEDVSLLFHKFLCLSAVPVEKARNAFEHLKEKAVSIDIFNELVRYIDKVFIRRESVANFCLDWSVHGKQCSTNYNDDLKKRFCNPESKCSFISFLKLLCEEAKKITSDYEKLLSTDKENKFSKTRRVTLFEKEHHSLVNGSIDIQMFLKRLTYVDNSGHVEYMNNYTIGDENEIDLMNDEDRNGMIAANSIEQQPVNLHDEVQDTSPEMTCSICLIGPKNTMLLPCRHLKFCAECIDTLSEPRVDEDGVAIIPKCPVCRFVYTEVVHPFLWFVVLP